MKYKVTTAVGEQARFRHFTDAVDYALGKSKEQPQFTWHVLEEQEIPTKHCASYHAGKTGAVS